jgi:arylsulfatase A-like enzyme
MYLPENDPDVENSKQAFDPIDLFLWAGLPWGVQYNGSPWFQPAGYMTDYLTDEALHAIDANRNRPFFLYFAPNAVHTPLQARREDFDALPNISDHRLRVYGAMVRDLDRNVGRILSKLHEDGLDQNTLIIFTSDNGGANYIGLPDINRPFRGWKATFFEGGMHVPYFIEYPGHIQPGTHYPQPVAHVDIFATAAAAAGATIPTDRAMDGVDLLPFITGQTPGEPHKNLFWRSGNYSVVLEGGWKLQRMKIPFKEWLFNLHDDPTEQVNLVLNRPDIVDILTARMNQIDAQQEKPLWPSILSGAIAIDHPMGVPTKPDDEFIYWDN